MVRSAFSKAAWVGRTASMVFGLALVLALVFGAASAAFGANGANLLLGQNNVATLVTRLTGPEGVNGPMFEVINNDAGANDTALSLEVQADEAPMVVNSQRKVTNLNSDKLDGQSSAQLEPLTAVVGSGGGLSDGKGAVSASKESTGVYTVVFNQPVGDCARVASVGREMNVAISPSVAAGGVPGGEVSTFNSTAGGIGVVTRDSAGNVADRGFHLGVFC